MARSTATAEPQTLEPATPGTDPGSTLVPKTADPTPSQAMAAVAGWPTVSRAGITMAGVVEDSGVLDGRLRLSVTVGGLAPGEAVSLAATAVYRVRWVCGQASGPCGELGCTPKDFGTTEGTADAATQTVAGSGGTATTWLELVATPPAEPCPADASPPLGTRLERWEQVVVADREDGLILTPETIERGETY